MYMLLIFPVVLLFLSSLTFFSKRKADRAHLGRLLHFMLFAALMLPWALIVFSLFRGNLENFSMNASPLANTADLWLLSCQAMLALVLLLVRAKVESPEAWFKAFVSAMLGILFLVLSLHPVLGLPFAIDSREAAVVSAVSFIVGLFLLFGLPPLQLGVIDLGSEKNASLHVFLNVSLRYCLGFVILFTLGFNNWVQDIEALSFLIAGAIFLGVGLTRIVLRLQTNLFRMLSYLTSGLALSLALQLLFAEYGELFFFAQVLGLIPIVAILNERSPDASGGLDLQNWANFRRFNGEAAERLHMGLRLFLYLEVGVSLATAVGLAMKGHFLVALTALFAGFCAFVVTRDKHAFAPRLAA